MLKTRGFCFFYQGICSKHPFKLITTLTLLRFIFGCSEVSAQVSISSTVIYTENFDALGTGLNCISNWKVQNSSAPIYSNASSLLNFQASSGSSTSAGFYNWGTTASERAIGVMSSGSFASPNSLMGYFKNTNSNNITELSISYDCERYRVNTAAASVQFYYSLDGMNWIAISAGNIASSSLPTGSSLFSYAPQLKIHVSTFTISGLAVSSGSFFYLRWNLNTSGANSQGIGIDNVNVSASFSSTCIAPEIQALSLKVESSTDSSSLLSWTRGNGTAGVVVIAKSSSEVNSLPVNGVDYISSNFFGSGQEIGDGNFFVYKGIGTSATINNQNNSSNYHFAAFEYNTANTCYKTPGIVANAYTLASEPKSKVSSLSAQDVQAKEITLNFSAPNSILNANGYIILQCLDSNPNSNIQDGVSYSVGNLIGNSTVAAIINDLNISSITLTELTQSSNYNFSIIPFGRGGNIAQTYNYYTTEITYLSGIKTLQGSKPGDFFRTKSSGNWNSYAVWQSSTDGVNWVSATEIPSVLASGLEIRQGHTMIMNSNITLSSILINGTLSFDSTSGRQVIVNGDINISNTGIFNCPYQSGYGYLIVSGDIINDNILDFYTNGYCDVTFNKNGNQTISGIGTINKFNVITVDMGSSRNNILEIKPATFFTNTEFLNYSSSTINELRNGTVKFSGTYTYSNTVFYHGNSHEILSSCGIWLNNPNVTIAAENDSWDLFGLLRITQGTFNVGTASGNSIRTRGQTAEIIIEGGNLNVAGRISPLSNGGSKFTYSQSGGTVLLNTKGNPSNLLASFDMSSSASVFNMSGGIIIIRDKSGTISSARDFYNPSLNFSITGGNIQFGDAGSKDGQIFKISSLADLPSLIISNANSGLTKPKLRLSSNLNVKGDITIMSGSSMDAASNDTLNFDINLSGNWMNYGEFNARNKTLSFCGSMVQQCRSNGNVFYNVIINNAGIRPGLILVDNLSVSNVLTLTKGIVSTGNNVVIINSTINSALAPGIGNDNYVNSFINGNLRRYIANSSMSIYDFPVGVYDGVRLIKLKGNNFSVSGNYLDANFSNAIEGDKTISLTEGDLTYDCIHESGRWQIEPSGSITNTYDVYLYVQGFDGLTDNRFGILKRPSESISSLHWNTGNGNINQNGGEGRLVNNGYALRKGLNSFSQFVIGISNGPLPVQLIEFKAECDNRKTVLNWTTASETNNEFFTLEKTMDGKFYETVGKITGAGNSTCLLNYELTDLTDNYSTTYYRLKQTDYDGKFEYSNLVSSDCFISQSIDMNVNSDKETGKIHVGFFDGEENKYQLYISDYLGRSIIEEHVFSNQGINNFYFQINPAPGIYFIRLTNEKSQLHKKIIF